MVSCRTMTTLFFAIVFPDLVKRFTICVFSQWGKSDYLVIIMQILAAFRVVSPFDPAVRLQHMNKHFPVKRYGILCQNRIFREPLTTNFMNVLKDILLISNIKITCLPQLYAIAIEMKHSCRSTDIIHFLLFRQFDIFLMISI